MRPVLFLLISCLFIHQCWSYRILAICPTPSYSHQMVFHAMVENFLERGHELVVLTTNPISTDNPNITQIDLSAAYNSRLSRENLVKTRGMKLVQIALDDVPWVINKSLTNPQVQKLIQDHNNQQFDAVFVEYVGFTPFYAFPVLFDTLFIGFTTLQMDSLQHEALGNPVHPAIHSPNMAGFYRPSTLLQRLWNLVVYLGGKVAKLQFYSRFDALIENNFGSGMPKSSELVKKVDLLFLQQNPLLGSVRPMVPNIITTSFLHIRPSKPLSKELKSYLNNSPQGAIYFSLGTIVRSDFMSQNMEETFLQAFRGLKYNILWKRSTNLSSHESNILTSSWFPQQDLLDHYNLKLFMTQGGLQSVEEAISRGVPLIVIPFYYDQYDNAEMVQKKQIGVRLHPDDLTVDSVRAAIEEVISNPVYKRNILRLRNALQDEPMKPCDKVSWWLEFAIRNKEEIRKMRYEGTKLTFVQYYFIDVGVFLIFVVTVAILMIKSSWTYCVENKTKKTKNHSKEKSN